MAAKGGLGMELDLDLVPVREEAMTLMKSCFLNLRKGVVLHPDARHRAYHFEEWDLELPRSPGN